MLLYTEHTETTNTGKHKMDNKDGIETSGFYAGLILALSPFAIIL